MGGRKEGSEPTEKLAGSLILEEMLFVGVGFVEWIAASAAVSGVSLEVTIEHTDLRERLRVEPRRNPEESRLLAGYHKRQYA